MLLNLLRKKLVLDDTPQYLCVDENLPQVDRFLLLSRSDSMLQRLVCLNDLIDLCYELSMHDILDAVTPRILALLRDDDSQVRIRTYSIMSRFVSQLLQADFDMGYAVVCEVLLPRLIGRLWEDRSDTARFHLMECLVGVCAQLRAVDKGELFLVPLISRASVEKDEYIRAALVETFGMISPSLGKQLTGEYIVAELCAMAEDSSSVVKQCIPQAMKTVLGLGVGVNRLIPLFSVLCEDSDAAVRETCAEMFSEIVAYWGAAVLWAPVCVKLLRDALPIVRTTMQRKLGTVLDRSTDLSEPAEQLIEQYIAFPEKDVRAFCGLFAKMVEKENVMVGAFENCFWSEFICSNDPVVLRITLQAIPTKLWEFVGISATQTNHNLYEIFHQLLSHAHVLVREAAIGALPAVVEFAGLDSRLVESLISALRNPPSAYPVSEQAQIRLAIAKSLVALIHTRRSSSQLVCAVWTLLLIDPYAYIREIAIEATRELFDCVLFPSPLHLSPFLVESLHVCVKLCADFGSSRIASRRQTFLRIVGFVMELRSFPDWLFDLIFLPQVVLLADDDAAVVRTVWAKSICPHVRFPGGRYCLHRELVLRAQQKTIDSDSEIVRTVSKINFCPVEETKSVSMVSRDESELVAKVTTVLNQCRGG